LRVIFVLRRMPKTCMR